MKRYTVDQIGNAIRFMKTCEITGQPYVVYLSVQQYEDWRNGKLIQNVVPHYSVEEREFIISGITPREWDSMMGEDL